jgi:hypothetical protein
MPIALVKKELMNTVVYAKKECKEFRIHQQSIPVPGLEIA